MNHFEAPQPGTAKRTGCEDAVVSVCGALDLVYPLDFNWSRSRDGFSRPTRSRLVYRSWEVVHSIGAEQGFPNP
jgi:hypothetical protein